MSACFSETDLVDAIERLTHEKLERFMAARLVQPAQGGQGRVFRQIDVARLELLCELSDEFDMHDDAIELVMSLIDQLHGVRAELKAMTDALGREPDEVRARVVETLFVARATGGT